MNGALDIAAAVACRSLTLFVGSGLTSFLTDGVSPGWPDLFVRCIAELPNATDIRDRYFTSDDGVWKPKYDILVVAEMVEFEFRRHQKDLRLTVCAQLRESVNEETINWKKAADLQRFFKQHPDVNVITTNFDTALTDFVIPDARVLVEGGPVSQVNTQGSIYHVHGRVSHPESLVLTIQDYFRFLRVETYFSRKLFTLLQESTVVVLGYSLGDVNLNAILNEAKRTRAASYQRAQIFYVSRDLVDRDMRDFYFETYGIEVVDGTEIDTALAAIESVYPRAETLIRDHGQLTSVLEGTHQYPDEFLKLYEATQIILTQAAVLGIHAGTPAMADVLRDVLARKRTFTHAPGAWEQYEHLAEWLVALGAKIDVTVAGIAKEYAETVLYSFATMSRERQFGSSWAAFRVWRRGLSSLLPANRTLVDSVIRAKAVWTDAAHLDPAYAVIRNPPAQGQDVIAVTIEEGLSS